jgi:hypothetical protein
MDYTRGLKEINKDPDAWLCHYRDATCAVFHTEDRQRQIQVRQPYRVGDTWWMREAWRVMDIGEMDGELTPVLVAYKAGPRKSTHWVDTEWREVGGAYDQAVKAYEHGGWQNPMFMPRWASRFSSQIVACGLERLQDITRLGELREGFTGRQEFLDYWVKVYGADAWTLNPWVWVPRWRKPE